MFKINYDSIENSIKGTVFNIEHFHVHDGEGIRTNVFLKGCTLRCPWCCNPESLSPKPEVAHYMNICNGCGACIRVCPENCISCGEDGRVMTDHSKCIACGRCASVCPAGARELFGQEMSVAEVMAEVEKDSFYFMNSDGGLTVSGGECCMQPDFARGLVEAAHRRYFPVAVETAGAVPFENLWKVCEHADEILFDMKVTSDEQFSYIGRVSFDLVKKNLSALKEYDKIITLRCPIIPDFNDNDEHIENIGRIAKENAIEKVDLLPFHQLGKHKYEALGLDYKLTDRPEMDRNVVKKMADILYNIGLDVSIGG